MEISVYNDTGGVIAAAQVVYQSGIRYPSQLPTVALASAAAAATAAPMGITVDAIADATIGYIVITGNYYPIDTSAFAANADAYLSNTPGAIATTAGTVESLVGSVTTASASGTLDVSCQSTTSFVLSPVGTVSTPGINSVDFDGVDEQIELGTAQLLSSSAAFTFSYWAKAATVGTYSRAACIKTDLATDLHIGFTTSVNWKDFFFGGGSSVWGQWRAEITGGFQTDTWYHVAITYAGSSPTSSGSWACYIDGSAETVTTASSLSGTGGNIFGSRGGSRYMDGLLDNVSIWSSVLSADAITSIYNFGACIPLDASLGNYSAANVAALVHWWRLGADTGDATGTGNILDTTGSLHGTTVNMESGDLAVADVPS